MLGVDVRTFRANSEAFLRWSRKRTEIAYHRTQTHNSQCFGVCGAVIFFRESVRLYAK